MSPLPHVAHVTMPQPWNVAGTVQSVAEQLSRAHAATGGRSTIVGPVARTAADLDTMPVAYGKVSGFTRREMREDMLAGALGRVRPHFGRMFDPAVEAVGQLCPDIVVIHEGHYAAASLPRWESVRRQGSEVVLYVHNGLSRSYTRPELRRLLRHSDRIVFVSAVARAEALERLGGGDRTSRFEVVHNGLTEDFRAAAPRTQPPPGDPVVTFFGRTTELKGPHLAVQAADLARRMTGLPISVRVIGDAGYGGTGSTPYEKWLRERCQAIETPVTFHPHLPRSDVVAQLAESAITCLPTSRETFGLTVLESFGMGVPVVCSDLPVLRDLFGDALLACSREDIEGLAGAIADLLEQPELYAAHSRLGWDRAQRFSWQAAAIALADPLRNSPG